MFTQYGVFNAFATEADNSFKAREWSPLSQMQDSSRDGLWTSKFFDPLINQEEKILKFNNNCGLSFEGQISSAIFSENRFADATKLQPPTKVHINGQKKRFTAIETKIDLEKKGSYKYLKKFEKDQIGSIQGTTDTSCIVLDCHEKILEDTKFAKNEVVTQLSVQNPETEDVKTEDEPTGQFSSQKKKVV